MTRFGVFMQMLLLFISCSFIYVTADFSISTPSIPLNSLVFVGNGSVSTTEIVLSLGQPATSSVVYWNEVQNVLYGFETAIIYNTSDCDSISYYKGGDGFTFFFASAINTTEVLSTGGTLGLANKTYIAMVGVDMLNNKIVNGATADAVLGPRGGYNETIVTGLSALRCAGTQLYFQLQYVPPVFTITNNVTNLNVSITMDLGDYFNPYSQLYVGLSAASGEAYMKQVVTDWEFTGTTYPDVVPILECYEQLDGSQQSGNAFVAHMGYQSSAYGSVSIPISSRNGFNPAPQSRGQPTLFESGRSPYYPLNAFSFPWDGSDVTWNLTSNFVTFNGANTALLCPKSLKVVLVFMANQEVNTTQINTILQSIANFLEISPSRLTAQNVTFVQITKRSTTQNNQEGTLELEIGDTTSQTQNEPSAADSVQKFVSTASNSTVINQVLNPPGTDTTVDFVSLTPKPIGVGGTGSLIVQSPVSAPTTIPVSAPTSIPSTVPSSVSAANQRRVMWISLLSRLLLHFIF